MAIKEGKLLEYLRIKGYARNSRQPLREERQRGDGDI
jgi:hypothetical protein